MAKVIKKVLVCSVFIIFMVWLLFVCIAEMGWPFTWEGELNPDEFPKWKVIDVRLIGTLKATVTIQNPNTSAEIQRVQMTVHINSNGSGTLLSYRYFKGGKIYEYETNVDMNRYERRKYTDKERRACMRCHAGLISELPI